MAGLALMALLPLSAFEDLTLGDYTKDLLKDIAKPLTHVLHLFKPDSNSPQPPHS